jgi:AraC family transcriptional regulator
MAWAGQRGLLGGRLTILGIVHDDPEVTPAEKVRYDACLAVEGAVRPEGEVGVQEIVGGEFAVATHRGPYDRLADTYAMLLGRWLASSGREPGPAPGFEVYRNPPAETPPPELVTDIHIPLAGR